MKESKYLADAEEKIVKDGMTWQAKRVLPERLRQLGGTPEQQKLIVQEMEIGWDLIQRELSRIVAGEWLVLYRFFSENDNVDRVVPSCTSVYGSVVPQIEFSMQLVNDVHCLCVRTKNLSNHEPKSEF